MAKNSTGNSDRKPMNQPSEDGKFASLDAFRKKYLPEKSTAEIYRQASDPKAYGDESAQEVLDEIKDQIISIKLDIGNINGGGE